MMKGIMEKSSPNFKKRILDLYTISVLPLVHFEEMLRGGALEYGSDASCICLPENENRGHSVKNFVEKRWSLGVGSKTNWAFFGVNLPK